MMAEAVANAEQSSSEEEEEIDQPSNETDDDSKLKQNLMLIGKKCRNISFAYEIHLKGFLISLHKYYMLFELLIRSIHWINIEV